MQQIKKHKFTAFVIGLGILLISVIPILVNLLATKAIFEGTSGEFNSWLGFWGSYFGGIVSGVLTLGGVYIGINHERKYSLYLRYISHKRQLDKFVAWVEDIGKLARYIEDTDIKFLESYKRYLDEGEDLINSISGLDINIYQEARNLIYEYGWLLLNFEQAKGTDEYNKKYAFKKIPENIKDINEIIQRINKKVETLERDFKYY
ncbi:hypothetical protein OXB_2849 [Bacillus sp. OxB-1]|uniref:MFS transporter n=1 Tax=Bacillus sp. (strain OxB-1) TaxID=98228 RepID=UPI00058217CC|nr:MFS transporter [Bacillus sp. OxB-1]BAQ11320.1 hypothetical protein OXB_2849 [Bacillus sp. OxB-1]